jgi:Site-specific recombinases, DNA invertase Pin homologs
MKTITIKATKKEKVANANTGRSAQDVIREAYESDTGKMTIIPASLDASRRNANRKQRKCGYGRVSTGSEEQASSYEMQYQYYKEMIQANPNWEFVGVYADKGLSGTSVKKRDEFLRMIEDCKAGKIDQIIVKQISRFSRNVEDCLHYTRLLKNLSPPVSVYFETQHINSLSETSESQIITACMVAQGESEGKSISMKWSNRNRFRKGIIYPVYTCNKHGDHSAYSRRD